MIFHRTNLDAHSKRYLEYAKAKGLVTLYDTDDLIFSLDGNEHLMSSPSSSERAAEGVDLSRSYRAVLQACDVVVVSTNYLKREAEKFHPDVRLMKNGLADWFESGAEAVVGRRDQQPGKFTTIGYLSGSRYHDRDFELVQDTLLALLEEIPHARVLLAGKLNFSDRFHQFRERFVYQPFVLYRDIWKIFESIDINIVPLRTEDPFVQSRSEIKYTEAGIFGIPTVASPSGTYAEAISHGVNGLLVDDDDWYGVLKSLLLDQPRRQTLGEAARADVKANYGHERRAAEWDAMMRDILERYSGAARANGFESSTRYWRLWGLWAARMTRIGARQVRSLLKGVD
jgi:glycosyltransferase involved in cell wall biosynthesis